MSKCLSCETEHTKFSFALLFVFLTISPFHFQGKRRHRRPRWSNIRTKRRKLNEGEEPEDKRRKRGEAESEGRSDSEESCKSEEVPVEDACSHCGLPNHPELVRVHNVITHIQKYLDTSCPHRSGYVWGLARSCF